MYVLVGFACSSLECDRLSDGGCESLLTAEGRNRAGTHARARAWAPYFAKPELRARAGPGTPKPSGQLSSGNKLGTRQTNPLSQQPIIFPFRSHRHIDLFPANHLPPDQLLRSCPACPPH